MDSPDSTIDYPGCRGVRRQEDADGCGPDSPYLAVRIRTATQLHPAGPAPLGVGAARLRLELVPRAQSLGLDHVDRPAVYRALSQLEQDGLVVPSSQNPTAGQARRVYRITPDGERVFRDWMGVVKAEHHHLAQVLRRYLATGTTDSVLAEVEGGWSSALGAGWSAVSPTSLTRRWLEAVPEADDDPTEHGSRQPTVGGDQRPDAGRRPFRLIPDRSAVLIEVRSTVGPLSFGAMGVTGTVDATVIDGLVRPEGPASAVLEVDLTGLRSGNSMYDAELLRRIEARRYPTRRTWSCSSAPQATTTPATS